MPEEKERVAGTWWIESKSDPRWNCEGTFALLFCQTTASEVRPSNTSPSELRLKIAELKNQYGDPPEDGTWGYRPHKNVVLPPMEPTVRKEGDL